MAKELTLQAVVENIPVVTELADAYLKDIGCSGKSQMQIDIAIDEIFSNISRYAYGEQGGTITVRLDFEPDLHMFSMQFIDEGIPFNPLETEEPDVSLSAEEREVGGLGIFLVKKTMNSVLYEYKNNTNILTIKKEIES
jgi:anti-sigma regulatory factor (Ser/Thr protein kinase)